MKAWASRWRYRAPALAGRAGARIGLMSPPPEPVGFIVEKADWAIRRVGDYVRAEIEKTRPGFIMTTTQPQRLTRHVVHFGSQYMWPTWGPHLSPANRYVISYFHGKPEDGPDVAAFIARLIDLTPKLDRIVVSASIVEARMKGWGVPAEKIVRIPIGVDMALFQPPSEEARAAARHGFGFTPDQTVIGSFQKDGVGWGDGMEPKAIKGPDLFLDAVDRLRRDRKVAVLLTGPARGYVKQGLERMGVPFAHTYVEQYAELTTCYHALDLYLVTSREEGGPMGLMESMSSGVPVVSTPVGMAPDLLIDGETGGLTGTCCGTAVADRAGAILGAADGVGALTAEAREAVRVCAWPVVAERHLHEVYMPLIAT